MPVPPVADTFPALVIANAPLPLLNAVTPPETPDTFTAPIVSDVPLL
jgi:hypothetical protein